MTNPILGELNSLSPGAKAALAQAHGAATSAAAAAPKLITDPSMQQLPPAVGAPMGPSGPPPTPASIPAPSNSAVPALPSTPAPSVQAPRGTIQGDEAERGRLLTTGSGVSQIKNPFLRGLGEVGSTIGHIVAPGLSSQIPGTEDYHQKLLNQDASQIGTSQKLFGNDLGNSEAQAKTRETNDLADNLENPQQKFQPLSTDQGEFNYDPRTGKATPIQDDSGQTLQSPEKQFNKTPEEMAFEGAIKGGMQPIDAYRAIKDAGNVKDPTLQQQYLDALSSGDQKKMQAIASTIRATSTEPKIEIKQTETPGQGNKQRDAATEKEYTAAAKDLNTQFATAQTQGESIKEAQNLINSGAIGQALGVVKTMVGLAGGKGSGVRITQAELNSIAQARGIQGNFEGWLNKLSGKGNLSSEQERQINAVLQDAQAKIQQKQKMLSDTLDNLGTAATPQEIRQIQSDYRHQVMGSGDQPSSSGKGVSLKAAMQLPINKGKSEDQVRQDIKAHGHQVVE